MLIHLCISEAREKCVLARDVVNQCKQRLNTNSDFLIVCFLPAAENYLCVIDPLLKNTGTVLPATILNENRASNMIVQ